MRNKISWVFVIILFVMLGFFIFSKSKVTPLAQASSVLQPSDFTYLGCFTLPNDNHQFSFSLGLTSGRRYTDSHGTNSLRLLISGRYSDVYEVGYPGAGDCTSDSFYSTAPTAPIYRSWNVQGSLSSADLIFDARNGNTSANAVLTGIGYVGNYRGNGNELFANFVSGYQVAPGDSTFVSDILNDDGTVDSKGPWNNNVGPQTFHGSMFLTPPAFAAATGAGPVTTSASSRGNQASGFRGANALSFTPPARSKPADVPALNGPSNPSVVLNPDVYFDVYHAQARNTNYYVEGGRYDLGGCSAKSLTVGNPVFGSDPSLTTLDWPDTAVWIDTGTKRGFLSIGQLGENSAYQESHNYYGGYDPVTHGDCYGLGPGLWAGATGPQSTSLQSWWWIFDPNDFVNIAKGITPAYSPRTTSEGHWSDFSSGLGDVEKMLRGGSESTKNLVASIYQYGGTYFDPQSKLLFVTEDQAYNHDYSVLPVIHVFQLNDGQTAIPEPTVAWGPHPGSYIPPAPAPGPAPTPPPPPITTGDRITISADNEYSLYFNGTPIGGAGNWVDSETYALTLQNGKNVVAVKGIDYGAPEGLIAEINAQGERLGTSASWKYSLNAPTGWEQPNFDDSSWLPAIDQGAYGTSWLPWSSTGVTNVPQDTPAHWIWGPYQATPAYFRYSFNKTVASTPPSTLVGDFNHDNIVNSLDWSYMNTHWFTADATADLNHDGIVNSLDFSILNKNWGKTN